MASETARQLAVITDSTADITPEIAARYGVEIVPLSVTISSTTLPDGQLTQAEFFERMNAADRLPTTSQPPVGAFVEAYERALSTAEQVLSVHISSKLSGTVESAQQAAQQFAGRVQVFDSLNLSWGLAFQVLDAASAAAEGLSLAEALDRVTSVRDRVQLIVGLDRLDNLAKGGRIGRVSALFGSLLNLKVAFCVAPDGAFEPLFRARGEKAALAQALDWVSEKMGTANSGKFAVGHALSPERAERIAAALRERFHASEMIMYETGSVISTHTGTGWGIAFVPEA